MYFLNELRVTFLNKASHLVTLHIEYYTHKESTMVKHDLPW